MCKYTILGRQRNGTVVVGYVVKDEETNRIGIFSKEDVYRLALAKQINDVVTQNYNGKITMKGTKYRISDLPNYDMDGNIIHSDRQVTESKPQLYLNGKYVDGKNITAYRVAMVENGRVVKEATICRDKVMEFAQRGMIANARHQKSNGIDILRGVGCKLSALPSL